KSRGLLYCPTYRLPAQQPTATSVPYAKTDHRISRNGSKRDIRVARILWGNGPLSPVAEDPEVRYSAIRSRNDRRDRGRGPGRPANGEAGRSRSGGIGRGVGPGAGMRQ